MVWLQRGIWQTRYHREQRRDRVGGEPAGRGRWPDSASVGRADRDEALDTRLKPNDANPAEMGVGGDADQRKRQAIEVVRRVGDRDGIFRVSGDAKRGILLSGLSGVRWLRRDWTG
jgi:hypothetical protein